MLDALAPASNVLWSREGHFRGFMEQAAQNSNFLIGDRARRLKSSPFPYIVLFILAANFGAVVVHRNYERLKRENFMLRPYMEERSGEEIRWDKSVGENLQKYLPQMPDATKTPVAVVVGMSQMYAINDAKPGDEIISEHLDDLLSKRGVRAFGLAAPNIHNEEALELLLALLSKPSTAPRFFVYGVCLDKFRNIDLRPSFQKYLRETPELRHNWEKAAGEYKARLPLASGKMLSSFSAAMDQVDEGSGKSFEERLRRRASSVVPLLEARQGLNAFVLGYLFDFRNWVFNIKTQTKRPLIQSRYDLNKEFLQMIAEIARANGVTPIFYVVPLNPQAENPYVPGEYAEFKLWLESYCLKNGIPFANFENAVPAAYWGEFMGGPDFKHFRGEGHRLTARAIYNGFNSLFLKAGPR